MPDPSVLSNPNNLLIGIIGAIAGGIGTITVAMISGLFQLKSSKAQIAIAEINRDKEAILQSMKLKNETEDRIENEILDNIREVHATVSKMAHEYSQTRSHMDWSNRIEKDEFRRFYKADCETMHKAFSIVDIYLTSYKYPQTDIRDSLFALYEQMNVFWGHQELLLGSSKQREENREAYTDAHLSAIIQASNKISKHADIVRRRLVEVADAIRQCQRIRHG